MSQPEVTRPEVTRPEGPGPDATGPDAAPETPAAQKALTPEAHRALAEAEARRQAQTAAGTALTEEIGGRKGPDPVRFGDWEVGGIASDF